MATFDMQKLPDMYIFNLHLPCLFPHFYCSTIHLHASKQSPSIKPTSNKSTRHNSALLSSAQLMITYMSIVNR